MEFDSRYDSARPYIACFVILRRDNKIAMVLRQNTGYMDGYYGLPAGKVEWGEVYTRAAVREAREEAGVRIEPEDLFFVHIAHRHGDDGKVSMDWVDVYFEAAKWSGEPFNAEPAKSERLDWLNPDNLPKNIVPPQLAALKNIAKGIPYGEFGWNDANS